MSHNRVDITGENFGKLTAVSFKAGTRTTPSAWLCECKCGNKTYATAGALRSGQRTSCGCSRSTATKEHLATSNRRSKWHAQKRA